MTRFIDDNQKFVKVPKEDVMNAISDLSDYVKKKTMSGIITNIY